DRHLLAVFVAGGVVGTLAGSQFVVSVPRSIHLVGLGLFVLAMVWLPRPKAGHPGQLAVAVGGSLSTIATLFAGATGPLVMAIMSGIITDRRVLVGTNAACMSVQNILKTIVFAAAGFAFAPWLPLAAAIIGCGFLGTVTGTTILQRLPERAFRIAFKSLITLLSMDMIRRGFTAS
ncbi:MAG: TSUP family transporter, partial [Alphaproteobacteria bacterium]